MFKWNLEKNKTLYEIRGITFEMVVQAISDGYGISDVPHWNHDKYPNQRIITVMINGYAHLVPQERGRNNFPNYASQLQAIFARSESTKILK